MKGFRFTKSKKILWEFVSVSSDWPMIYCDFWVRRVVPGVISLYMLINEQNRKQVI